MMDPDTAVYISILPQFPGNFQDEWNDCIEKLTDYTETFRAIPIKLAIFIDSEEKEDYEENRHFIHHFIKQKYKNQCPTFCVLPQTPERPFKIAMEVGLIHPDKVKVSYKKFHELPYVTLSTSDAKELWVSGITQEYCPLDMASSAAFDELRDILALEDMSFDDIVRQWNYIGCILQTLTLQQTITQNYQIFNEVRHTYYERYRKIKGFPAATGIGKKFEGVIIDCCAFRSNNLTQVCSIESPVQRNAYEYDQQVLIGTPFEGHEIKHAPAFERAKLIKNDYLSHFFISGTASISGQNTVDAGNTHQQTVQTILNIDTLSSIQNIHNQYPGCKFEVSSLRFVRVYVKELHDMEAVKKICKKHYGAVPITIVQADICRDELLVELEAEMKIS
jgi:hypothetical protein